MICAGLLFGPGVISTSPIPDNDEIVLEWIERREPAKRDE
jgi:hypothetical protein